MYIIHIYALKPRKERADKMISVGSFAKSRIVKDLYCKQKDTKLTRNRFALTYAWHGKLHITASKVRTTCLMREINSIYAIKDSRRRCCR